MATHESVPKWRVFLNWHTLFEWPSGLFDTTDDALGEANVATWPSTTVPKVLSLLVVALWVSCEADESDESASACTFSAIKALATPFLNIRSILGCDFIWTTAD